MSDIYIFILIISNIKPKSIQFVIKSLDADVIFGYPRKKKSMFLDLKIQIESVQNIL